MAETATATGPAPEVQKEGDDPLRGRSGVAPIKAE